MIKYFMNLPGYQQIVVGVYAVIALLIVYVIGYMMFKGLDDEKQERNAAEERLRANNIKALEAKSKLNNYKSN